MPDSNPISGPYTGIPASIYHTSTAVYNRAVVAASPFIATGSNANSAGFYVSGSGATVTLLNGGSIFVPAAAAANPAAVYEMSVAAVTSGTVILLYK